MEKIETTSNMLKKLRQLGVQLSIDDFGTGYSSLSYLARLPLDTLKIDRSFVKEMLENEEQGEVVKAIIMLARALGLEVVAEGIETQEQFRQLHSLRCGYGQGYFFSRPVDAATVGRLLLAQQQQNVIGPGWEVDSNLEWNTDYKAFSF